MLFINKIREENFNIILINNFMIVYCISLLVSYRISGTIFYIMLFIFLINKNFKNFFLESLNNRVIQAFLLYFLLHFLWVIGSENLENALYQVRKNIILLSPILFYPVIRKEYIEKIFFYLIIVLYFSAIYSILLYFNILSIHNTISGEAIPFLYKSDYGFFLLLGIGYSFLKLTQNTNLLFQKVFLLSFILTSSVDIFLIGSRTFMFLYIFAIFLLAIIVYKKQIIKILLFTLFAISLFAIMYTQNSKIKYQIDDIIKGFESSFYEKEYQNSSGIRFGLIEYSIPVIKDNIWFGVGTGDHVSEVVKRIKSSDDYEFEKNDKYKYLLQVLDVGYSSFLHNTYIQTLVQFGLIGFIIWINIFYQIIKSKKSEKIYDDLSIFLVVIYLSMCFAGAELMYQNSGKMLLFIFSLLIYNKKFEILNINRI